MTRVRQRLQWVDVDGTVRGYGLLRKSDVGYRAGPLFADDVTIAVDLLRALCARVPRGAASGPVFVDVPEWSLGPLKGWCQVHARPGLRAATSAALPTTSLVQAAASSLCT